MTMIDTSVLRGQLQFDTPLSKYNTWGVGGNADCIFHPADVHDLAAFLKNNHDNLPITWLGLGSNVLVRDGGIRGVVIITSGCLNEIKFNDNKTVNAQAGAACAKLARAAVKNQLSGIEFMAGIPGTIGGALAMNAGAFGGQTWDWVTSVQTINREGKLVTRPAKEFDYGYRYVNLRNDEWFVSACFQLNVANENVVSVKELLQQRADTQPIGKKNCGSVFINPPGMHAAKLIEDCGLKGYQIGGACISTKHSNFILNEQNATAADIENLIQHIQKEVLNRFSIKLQPEVRILGAAK